MSASTSNTAGSTGNLPTNSVSTSQNVNSMTSGSNSNTMSGQQASQNNNAGNGSGDVLSGSKDVQTMISVLKDMGIEEFEPRVINQLLEFSYRYITNLLEDARAFSNHANKKNIDSEDIKMAIKSKVDYSFTTTPPRDLLMEISKSKNKNPLPPIKYHAGIRLPPDRFCLHSQNYALKSQNLTSHEEQQQQQQGQGQHFSSNYFNMNSTGSGNVVNQPQGSRVETNNHSSRQSNMQYCNNNNNSMQQQAMNTSSSQSSFMPPNLSIKRPRAADEDDYDI